MDDQMVSKSHGLWYGSNLEAIDYGLLCQPFQYNTIDHDVLLSRCSNKGCFVGYHSLMWHRCTYILSSLELLKKQLGLRRWGCETFLHVNICVYTHFCVFFNKHYYLFRRRWLENDEQPFIELNNLIFMFSLFEK